MREMTFTGDFGGLRDGRELTRAQKTLRIGAVCAILGALISVAAGIGFGNLTNEAGVETVMRYLTSLPRWYWPAVHLSFMFGAFLWVGALIALASTLRKGVSSALGRLGAACIILGAAIHGLDSSINGFALSAAAYSWADAPMSDQEGLLRVAETLLLVLGGVWASVIIFFHGLPFIFYGLAVVFSEQYPTWLGWIGVVGGAGSVVTGAAMFLGISFIPVSLFIVFALIVSLWMIVMGAWMWRESSLMLNH